MKWVCKLKINKNKIIETRNRLERSLTCQSRLLLFVVVVVVVVDSVIVTYVNYLNLLKVDMKVGNDFVK